MSLAQWNAAREFDVQAQGITLRLRIPTELQMRRIAAQVRAGSERAFRVALQEPLLGECVVGWNGVPAGLLGGPGESLLPFSREAIEAVLDRYGKAADSAYTELLARYSDRREAFEAAEKN